MDSIILHFDFIEELKELVSGGAKGVDSAGENWVYFYNNKNKNEIKLKVIKPNYDKYGRYDAPKIRNEKMAKYADELLLIWDGKSGGSYHMKQCMIYLKKPVHQIVIK